MMFCTNCRLACPEENVPCPRCGAPSPRGRRTQEHKRKLPKTLRRVQQFYMPHTEPLRMEYQPPELDDPYAFCEFNRSNTFDVFNESNVFNGLNANTEDDGYDENAEYGGYGGYDGFGEFDGFNRSGGFDELKAPDTDTLVDGRQLAFALQQVPDHTLAQLLPAQTGEPTYIAIPPTYTRPRPLIPLHRIISGLLSVLIVSALLCSGSIYYAQASGLFATVGRIYGSTLPKNIPSTVWAKLPDPPARAESDYNGPAFSIIPSATTTGRYDPKTYMALEPQTRFTVQQTIYLAFSVQMPKQDGRVIARWYTNNNYFLTQTSNLLTAKDVPIGVIKSGLFSMRYLLPSEGKVELYWNNQWAQTLHFVVNPA